MDSAVVPSLISATRLHQKASTKSPPQAEVCYVIWLRTLKCRVHPDAPAMQQQPSAAAIKAARSAAQSRHALINLTRLIRSLREKNVVGADIDGEEGGNGDDWVVVRRDWEVSMIVLRW